MNRKRIQRSLGFYVGLIFMSALLVLQAIFQVTYHWIAWVIIGVLVVTPLWGPEFVINLVRVVTLALRGSNDGDPRDDDNE